jgi:hypothetical protein
MAALALYMDTGIGDNGWESDNNGSGKNDDDDTDSDAVWYDGVAVQHSPQLFTGFFHGRKENVQKKLGGKYLKKRGGITRNFKHFRCHFAVPSVIHLLTQPG